MALASNLVKVIKEGQAQLTVPKTVFYNPVQEFNRDLSVLVVKTYLKRNLWCYKNEEKFIRGRGGMKLLDALSATGLRSIRYAKELGQHGDIVKNIVANDLSQPAADIIRHNIDHNQVQAKVSTSLSDAAALLHASSTSYDDRFHIIDIDPFGTGAQFFDAAVKSIGEGGLLMVTCTDTAVLCGNASESCFARYGSMSLKGDFCHDAALRIILRSLECHAAVYGRYIKPLMSISVDFYVRIFLRVFTQQAETKKSATKLSQIYLCKSCGSFELQPLGTMKEKENQKQAKSDNIAVRFKFKPPDVVTGDRCLICDGNLVLGGPIWSDPIHDKPFLEMLKEELALPEAKEEYATFRRIEGIVHLCSEELPNPLFYSLDTIGSKLQIPAPKSTKVLSALANANFKVSSTHANKRGFKTSAPNSIIWDVVCQAAEQDVNYTPRTPLALNIMSRPRKKDYDFTFNPLIESESKKLSLLRFQLNPEPKWGPKARPSKGQVVTEAV